jgi:phenylacetate-CoA ligase
MFTIFDDQLDAFARHTLADHCQFDAGGWSAPDLERHQLDNLRNTLSYVRERSPFYARQLGKLDESSIRQMTFEAFSRVSFTTKHDLRQQMYDMLSKPVARAWVFYETTGTTGRSTPCPRDNVDSLVNNTALTVCYRPVFRQHGDEHVVAVLGPTELHSTGDTFGDVCRNLGYTVVKTWPHSPVVGFPRALAVLRELRVTAVFCTPGMAMSLAKQAIAAGLDTRRDFSIRLFMFTGELATPGLLTSIGRVWDATAYNCLYASQEASVLGVVHADGRLRTVPLNVHYELIDPQTGRPVPVAADHQVGELVITHLYQGSKPLIRYRTGDLVRLDPPAPADRYPSRTLRPLGRVRDVIDLNGFPVNAYELEDLVLSRLVGAMDYEITIDRISGVDTLGVTVESSGDSPLDQRRAAGLADAAAQAWRCPLSVTYRKLGAITSTGAMVSWKAARVHDRRQEPDAERRAALGIARQREQR